MKNYKLRMVISVIVAAILLIHLVTPLFSMANNDELNLELTKVEIDNGYKINVTGASPTKILALRYIAERKDISDFNGNAEAVVAFFESDSTKALNITSDNYIDETFDVTIFGTYTVYVRNADGEIVVSHITINDAAAITLEVTSEENNDSKNLLIKAISTNNIVAVKVLKTNDATAPANFTNVANSLTEQNTNIELTYPILENGIYQVYVEDASKNKKIQTVNVFDGESPISINTEVTGTNISIKVTDSISSIQEIKMAKQADISTIADFSTKGIVIDFEGTNDITTSYEVSEQGNYVIFARDAAGSSFMQSVAVSSAPEQQINFYRLNSDNNTIYAIVTDNNSNITAAKYMISDEEKTLTDVKENGTSIDVTAGKTVTLEITSSNVEAGKFITIYVSDELEYGKMSGSLIGNIAIVDTLPGQGNNNEENNNNENNSEENKNEENNNAENNGEENKNEENNNGENNSEENKNEENNNEENNTDDENKNNENSGNQVVIPDNSDNQTNGNENPNSNQSNEDASNKENNENTTTNTDGSIDLGNLENGSNTATSIPNTTTGNTNNTDTTSKEDFSVIEDSKSANQTTSTAQSNAISKYPQTGTNEVIVFAGIILSISIAIYSFIKMKKEN